MGHNATAWIPCAHYCKKEQVKNKNISMINELAVILHYYRVDGQMKLFIRCIIDIIDRPPCTLLLLQTAADLFLLAVMKIDAIVYFTIKLQKVVISNADLFFCSKKVFDQFLVKVYALSFYRSQNVLCQSKFFESAQKFDCI